MTDPLAPEVLRNELAALNDRGRKIVVGLVSLLIKNPTRVKEREWVAEELSRVALLSIEDEVESGPQAIEDLQTYLGAEGPTLLGAALKLFQRAGLDLASGPKDGLTFDLAMQVVLGYLPPADR